MNYLASDTPQNILESIFNNATTIKTHEKAKNDLLKQNFNEKFKVCEMSSLSLAILGIATSFKYGFLPVSIIASTILLPFICLSVFKEQQSSYLTKIKEQESTIENILTKATEHIKLLQKFKAETIANSFNKNFATSSIKDLSQLLNKITQQFDNNEFNPTSEKLKEKYIQCLKLKPMLEQILKMNHSQATPEKAWNELHKACHIFLHGTESIKPSPADSFVFINKNADYVKLTEKTGHWTASI